MPSRLFGILLALFVGLPAFAGFAAPAAAAASNVTLAGTMQTALGCSKDWDEACAASSLTDEDGDGVWTADFDIPAGNHEFRITIDNSWEESYGSGDGNYPLIVDEPRTLTFSFDEATKKVSVDDPALPGEYTDADDALIAEPFRDPGEGENFYFVLTDRFANGDPSNDSCIATGHVGDDGVLPVDCSQEDRLVSGFDPTDRGFFHGGDIQGLREQLPYIRDLGQTAIWLTPSFVNRPVQGGPGEESAGYHGYWITDFTQIDPHFGTNEELKALIDEAHAMGIDVYFDIITNHTADVIYYAGYEGTNPPYIYKDDVPYRDVDGNAFDPSDYAAGDAAMPLMNPDTSSFPYDPEIPEGKDDIKFPQWLNDPTLYHNRGHDPAWPAGEPAIYMDFGDLDDLMTENQIVVDGMIDIYKTWVDFGVDGFRIDTVKHVDFVFWQEFTKAIADHAEATGNPDFFMFGEVYDADARLLSPYVRDTDMNSVLDFAYQSSVSGFAKGGPGSSLGAFFSADDYYTTPDSSASALPTFVGNHDMGRIGYLLKDTSNPLGRSQLAHSLMYLTRGQPVLYYGDEQLLMGDDGGQGGTDKAARESLFATQTADYADNMLLDGTPATPADRYGETVMTQLISELGDLRQGHEALRTGAQITLHTENGPGIFAFARVDETEKIEYLAAVNNSDNEASATFATLTPGAAYTPLYGTDQSVTADNTVTVTVPALSAVVLKADQTVAGADEAQAIAVDAGVPNQDGLTPVTADIADDRWAQTSFAYRVVGTDAYTPLGVSETDDPRVFADLNLPEGTLVEVRAISVDATGAKVADSSLVVVGTDLGSNAPAPAPVTGDDITLPGTHQQAMGCEANWDPSCTESQLTYDEASGLYSGTWSMPAGNYEYKVAVGGSWDENYGEGGVPDGANVTYTIAEASDVTYFYDPDTHQFFNTAQAPIVTLPGGFNSFVGCSGDWQPECLATLMFPVGDGTFTWSTDALPTGSYEVKVAHGQSWSENYGVDGAPDGANYSFAADSGTEIVFTYDLETHILTWMDGVDRVPGQDQTAAHWVDETTFAWPSTLISNPSELTYELWGGSERLTVSATDVTGTDAVKLADLTHSDEGLSEEQLEGRGHLSSFHTLGVDLDRAVIEDALKGDLMIVARDAEGNTAAATRIQIPGILDALYADEARAQDLGLTFADGVPSLRLWAPTALSVDLQIFDNAEGTGEPTVVAMERQADGSWTATGEEAWKNRAYIYDVEVYVPSTGKVENNLVTDPYSVGLAVNSTHSIILDLNDPAFMPEVWLNNESPVIENESARSIYELHIRDFSISDETVPQELRGTYEAFALEDTAGVNHLRDLSDAGMNTIHLLPSFDLATIEEQRSEQAVPDIPDAGPASPDQQAAVMAVADQDGFNWGYDPYHYTVPEGSYASDSNQNGGNRTAAFRQMVGGLHSLEYQVVLDQVFNHTAQSGQGEKSVLDRVVPGYYHRLMPNGSVANSTCCENIATEHAMAEQLMIDSVVTWVRDYRVDGFRFDLMGHHSVENMVAVQDALAQLTVEADGVDGSKVYIYGEGWNFGDDVQNNLRFTQATQGQLDGTGIGAFNDRLRDAVHGGGPFDESKSQNQGFGTGNYTDPNAMNSGSDAELASLRHQQDLIRLGMAGNLKDYSFVTSSGSEQTGVELDYNGAPAGFATSPEENVNYVDAHDNETLYDLGMWKLPADSTMDTRVRMNTVSLSTVMLGQSPAFWHAGTDLLRSKSMDRNSYNSGDHFNEIDWAGQEHNFGVGLPPAGDNEGQWGNMRPFLENPENVASPEDIAMSHAQALELLRLRSEHPLLTLGDATLIKEKVTFPGAGSDQQAGLILMRVDDTVGSDVDPLSDGLLVAINGSPEALTQEIPEMAGLELALSPVLTDGVDDDPVLLETTWDATTGKITVPARSAVVLVQDQDVIPTIVTAVEEPTFADGTVTIPETEGVEYVVDGEVVTGTIDVAEGETITVEARALPGYEIADGIDTAWSYTHEGETTEPTDPQCEVMAKPERPAASNGRFGDATGDLYADVWAINDDGELHFYKGHRGGITHVGITACDMEVTSLTKIGDVNSDRRTDFIGRHADGKMYFYYSTGDGFLQRGIQVGHGWNGMDLITYAGKLGSSNNEYVVARQTATGDLYRYTVSESGLYGTTKIGHGWGKMRDIVSVGHIVGSSNSDLIAIDRDGKMFAYAGLNNATVAGHGQIGHGWSSFTNVFAPGDLDGDTRTDLVGVRGDGRMFLYSNTGRGYFKPAVQIGHGWSAMKIVN